MFNLGIAEVGLLVLVGLFLVGPGRLPGYAADLAKMLRQARALAQDTRAELRTQLGADVADDLLHPRRFVTRQLQDVLADEPAPTPKPVEPERLPAAVTSGEDGRGRA